ncbi:MAG: hypothetical protein P4L42_03965 [Desulfocapsaceae bacterium]|nr:hypothetical protein [Desulfocapsaceae bacterium]
MTDWSLFPPHILPKLRDHYAVKSMRRAPKLFGDTSNFTSIDYGDVLHVGDRYLLVVGYTKEGRFGIDEQPKQWVPKVYDLESGERKIAKLTFHETYTVTIGHLEVTCYRSPEKEARVIELVKGNPYFMQGYSSQDQAGNLVRVLDVIQGQRLDKHLENLGGTHREYFDSHCKKILSNFLESVRGISLLHAHGLKHGDIRRDHIFVDHADGRFRWIDFDYDFYLPERPFALDLFGLGNVLLFILGRKNFRPADILNDPDMGPEVFAGLDTGDLSLVAADRVFNIRKIYPYIPKCLNDILMHFSAGTQVMYDSVDEFHDDLVACIDRI